MSPHAGNIRKDRLGHVKSTQWIKVFDSSQDRILFFAKTEESENYKEILLSCNSLAQMVRSIKLYETRW